MNQCSCCVWVADLLFSRGFCHLCLSWNASCWNCNEHRRVVVGSQENNQMQSQIGAPYVEIIYWIINVVSKRTINGRNKP